VGNPDFRNSGISGKWHISEISEISGNSGISENLAFLRSGDLAIWTSGDLEIWRSGRFSDLAVLALLARSARSGRSCQDLADPVSDVENRAFRYPHLLDFLKY